MLNLTCNDKPDKITYAKSIHAFGTQILVDKSKLGLETSKQESFLLTLRAQCITLMKLYTYRQHTDIKPNDVFALLIEYCGLPSKLFALQDKGVTRKSLDKERILKPVMTDLEYKRDISGKLNRGEERALRFLEYYFEYKQYKSKRDSGYAKIKKLEPEEYQGYSNKLYPMKFVYEEKETGRFYTNSDNIQGWPIPYTHAITVEKGYFLFWCDFAQVDFRVGYHIYLHESGSETDKVYMNEADKYRAMYTIICKAAGQEPDYEYFTRNRQSYKKGILSAMYNASQQALINDTGSVKIGTQLKLFFTSNPQMRRHDAHINDLFEFNYDFPIRDYFGFNRTLGVPDRADSVATSHLVSQAYNTPIQATSNSILMLWLEAVLQRFESLGYSRETDIMPYLVRHDEVIFKVRNEVLNDIHHMDDLMEIALDDWDTLTLEPHLGIYYKEPLPYLEGIYNESCEKNKDKLTPRTVYAPRAHKYYPLAPVLRMYCYTLFSPKQFLHKLTGETLDDKAALSRLHDYVKNNTSDVSSAAKSYSENFNKFILYDRDTNRYRLLSKMTEIFELADEMETSYITCDTVVNDREFQIKAGAKQYTLKASTRSNQLTTKILKAADAHTAAEGWWTL